jgi:hypothetical protein
MFIEEKYKNSVLGFRVSDIKGRVIFTDQLTISDFFTKEGKYKISALIPSSFLVPNRYFLYAAIHIPNIEFISVKDNLISFLIEETGSQLYLYSGVDYGCVFVKCQWSYEHN